MDTQKRIEKMLKKTEPILQVGRKDKPERLKPCPFCGADVESGVHIDVVVSFDELEDDTHYGVICENCGARIGYFKILEEAVEAWNRNKSRELFREKSRKADKT